MSMNPKEERTKSEKYRREGAKYVCNKCKNKYFSKEDVEKCYDSHFTSAGKSSDNKK